MKNDKEEKKSIIELQKEIKDLERERYIIGITQERNRRGVIVDLSEKNESLGTACYFCILILNFF